MYILIGSQKKKTGRQQPLFFFRCRAIQNNEVIDSRRNIQTWYDLGLLQRKKSFFFRMSLFLCRDMNPATTTLRREKEKETFPFENINRKLNISKRCYNL